MQISAEFVSSAAGLDDFPRERLAEIALVGRSNVGKSRLINALVRRQVARTSAAPGKTRLANFYRVKRGKGPAFFLVDLPGYGYARGGGRAANEFGRLAEAYFARAHDGADGSARHTRHISVLLLVDSRHPGLESDREAWAWLRSQPFPLGVVGTKADKLTRAERVRHARELDSMFETTVTLTSAETGEGLEELWKLIVKLPKQTAA